MTSFYKSKEGIEAYQQIQMPYPVEPWDANRGEFLQKTSRSPPELRVKLVVSMGRVKAGAGEYIVLSMMERAVTPIGNELHSFVTHIGQYPVPTPRYEMRVNDDGNKERYVASIAGRKTGYSIPWDIRTADKIYKGDYEDYIVIDDDNKDIIQKIQARRDKASKEEKAVVTDITQATKTMFYVMQDGDRQKMQVATYKELRDKSFESLYAWKHVHDEMISLARESGVDPQDLLKKFKEQQDRDKGADKATQVAYK